MSSDTLASRDESHTVMVSATGPVDPADIAEVSAAAKRHMQAGADAGASLANLLTEGRAILARKQASADQQAEALRADLAVIFAAGHRYACELLSPISKEVQVGPCQPSEGWNPLADKGHCLTFSIRPFGDQAGAIEVRIRGRYEGEWNHALSVPWSWRLDDDRHRYYVATHWRTYDGETDFVFADCWHETNSLAEALALCERHGERYRAEVKRVVERKALAKERAAVAKAKLSPGETLLDALEAYVRYLRPDVEE